MKKNILSFLFLLFSLHLFPCQCLTLEPISKESSKSYNVIFYGKVDSVSSCKNETSIAYFTIKELYKGSVIEDVKVNFDCTSSCMMNFERGEEWIIYGTYTKFDLLSVLFCEHSRKYFADQTKDFYELAAKRTFEQEKVFLRTELGIQPFIINNELNEQQKVFKPHNDQPSDINKLWLLLISFGTMGIILFFTRKKKNDK